MTTTLEQLKQKHALELKRHEREEAIVSSLPVPPRHVCAHDGKNATISISYEVQTAPEALEIYRAYLPFILDAEAWKGGCLSVAPEEINEYAKDERATLEFTSHASIVLWSYGERAQYRDTEMQFFAKVGGEILRVAIKIAAAPRRWAVNIVPVYDPRGTRRIVDYTIQSPVLGEDTRRRWWSVKPCYRFTYHWADTHNFESAIGHELTMEAKGGAT